MFEPKFVPFLKSDQATFYEFFSTLKVSLQHADMDHIAFDPSQMLGFEGQDREKAILNACLQVYPNLTQLLCTGMYAGSLNLEYAYDTCFI